jgi:hypothetical protein
MIELDLNPRHDIKMTNSTKIDNRIEPEGSDLDHVHVQTLSERFDPDKTESAMGRNQQTNLNLIYKRVNEE